MLSALVTAKYSAVKMEVHLPKAVLIATLSLRENVAVPGSLEFLPPLLCVKMAF